MLVSIISPVFFAEKILPTLINEINKVFNIRDEEYEIILVDDGSSDKSWEVITELSKTNHTIKGIKLSRNFGQHYALTAGIKKATGDINVIIDCDLQDPPSNIPILIDEYKKGFDIIFTKRDERKHGFFKSLSSKLFNWSFRFFSDHNFEINFGTMILFSEKAKEAFLQIEDSDRLYLQLFKWIGFKNTSVVVKHSERHSGKSSYTYKKLFNLALQGFTSFSNKLLKISVVIGLFFSFLSFLSIGLIIFFKIYYDFQAGWPSLVSIVFFCTGIVLSSLGILGLYIGKIFNQVKNRPLYIIDKEIR
jgi:dolichol-phosphate mannosyltransferase